MYIRIKLPAQYHNLESLKKDNFPYRSIFREFMKSVIKLGKRENLSSFAVFGRIEHELAADNPLDLNTTGDSVSLDYREDDESIIKFYKDSSLTQKQQTLMFVRLLLRLQGAVGNSVPEMIYLIDNIKVNQIDETEAISEVLPDKTTQSKTESSSHTVVPGIRIHKNTKKKSSPVFKPEPETKPATVKSAEPVTSSNDKLDVQTEDKKPASSVEHLIAHAEKLNEVAKEITDTPNAGDVVTTNPLLKNFYDFGN